MDYRKLDVVYRINDHPAFTFVVQNIQLK